MAEPYPPHYPPFIGVPVMVGWHKFRLLPDDELGRLDVGAVNLSCAVGLPGTEGFDFGRCRLLLDEMARRVAQETDRCFHLFRRRPQEHDYSEDRFRALALTTVLQRDFGLRYAKDLLELKDGPYFRDPANLFLHGALQGRGTCASLPVAYLAVGRRLGYPLKMATTWQHLFLRWEGDGKPFNIECTAHGFVSHPDTFYLTWPRPLTPQQVERFWVLRSCTPRQELAIFLNHRGLCWLENNCFREAVGAFANACELDKENWSYSHALVEAMSRWDRHVRARLMIGFPSLTIHFPPPQFPSLPRDLDRGIIHLMVKENLLNNPTHNIRWWQPLRRDPAQRPKGLPAHITVEYPPDGKSAPTVVFHPTAPPTFGQGPLQPA